MNRADIAPSEVSCLRSLEALEILDRPPQPMFDHVVQVASLLCGTPIALISLVDRDRLYFLARAGLDVVQVASERSLCNYATLSPQQILEVRDAREDSRFANSPLVTGLPGIVFYAGAPLVTETGEAIGTLCVIDRQPRQLNESQRVALDSLAQVTVQLMESRGRERELQRQLDARQVA